MVYMQGLVLRPQELTTADTNSWYERIEIIGTVENSDRIPNQCNISDLAKLPKTKQEAWNNYVSRVEEERWINHLQTMPDWWLDDNIKTHALTVENHTLGWLKNKKNNKEKKK